MTATIDAPTILVADRHFHVGLAGTNPHFLDQNVVENDFPAFFGRTNVQLAREAEASSVSSLTCHFPEASVTSDLRYPANSPVILSPVEAVPPNRHRNFLLQNHVVGK